MKEGKLIVIDGIDGSGKQTQTELLVKKFQSLNRPVATLDFPQYENNFFGKMVRRYLNGEFGPATEVSPYLASVLYAADRFESKNKIQAWLDEGKTVILDRYYTSNLIHQAAKLSAAELDKFTDWDQQMEFDIFQIPQPDLVIYLSVEPKIAHDLIAQRGQGHDGHDTLEHMEKSAATCRQTAQKLNWQTIECTRNGQILPIEKIAEKIWQLAEKF